MHLAPLPSPRKIESTLSNEYILPIKRLGSVGGEARISREAGSVAPPESILLGLGTRLRCIRTDKSRLEAGHGCVQVALLRR